MLYKTAAPLSLAIPLLLLCAACLVAGTWQPADRADYARPALSAANPLPTEYAENAPETFEAFPAAAPLGREKAKGHLSVILTPKASLMPTCLHTQSASSNADFRRQRFRQQLESVFLRI